MESDIKYPITIDLDHNQINTMPIPDDIGKIVT
mgnify:CR=1 FL=1